MIIKALDVTLTLKIANQFFHKTLRLMTINNNTNIGYKRSSGSGDMIRTESRHTNRHPDTQTHEETDAVIPIYPPPPYFVTGEEVAV